MLKRKMVAAFLTFVLSVLVVTLFLPLDLFFSDAVNRKGDFTEDLLAYSFYFSLGLFLYGFPVSILIEKITRKLPEGRRPFAFLLYVFFGFLPFFFLWIFTFYSLGISILFFIMDELIMLLRKGKNKNIAEVR
ncbi:MULTISPECIES: hypothetical protein [unclassified Bacillus (in: firmicutes)]|uniref:hypothetical protein n=1 Tax=unclassified Bacillus (in: firmicutes) TaxID=185979 RepID=UPI0004E0F7BB|nr:MULTISPECIES: hypothetical protein [unclassified Bacillus (in: firmicutes)]CAI9391563.1 hypothetical protein BACSP_03049 [Bacillus sp. T2.9-1]